jgi:hypothetical protein
MAFTVGSCEYYVDDAMGKVRDKAQSVTDNYRQEAEQWASQQEDYLRDLQKYLNGEISVEPVAPGPPPEVPGVGGDGYPSSADYNKAFGEGFLKYICENVVVGFSWDGKGTDVSSGSSVPDPTYPAGFSVSGSSGGGTLVGPGQNDVSMLNTFLGNLSALVSDLVVMLPVVSGATSFLPASVKFKAGAKLSANPASHVDHSNPTYEAILKGVCGELVQSFKANFMSETDAVHFVIPMANVPAGFSGKVKMTSLSFP